MTLDPTRLFASRPGRRSRRRFRLTRSRTAVLATGSALFIQLTAVPVPAVAATAAVSYTYDASGRLATVTTAAGTATYNYDAEGNLLSITQAGGGPRHGTAAGRTAAPTPVITSARPAVVASGKTIVISGRGFSATAVKDVVRVGDLLAHVTAASATELKVSAPPGTGGDVRVITPGGVARGPRVKITEQGAAVPLPPGRDPHPLRAGAGVTALSGLVETNKGARLPGVTITVASTAGRTQASTTTGSGGQFLIAHLASGRHQLIISANNVGGRQYGVYAEPVELPAGRTTVLPWVTYLTPLDMAHAITITSPAAREVNVTSPKLPGLVIQIPKGTVIRDRNGHAVTKVSLTPLTVGRTPYPLAPGMQPGFFTLQPGNTTVSGPGLRVIYPNATGQPPGTAIPYFIDSPDWAGTGWWRYGTGHVSANGKQIIPTAGTRWHIMELGGFGTNPPPNPNPPPCPGSPPPPGGGGGGSGGSPPDGPSCPLGGGPGDPINLGTGLMVNEATDLALPDVEGITLTRTYRQLDDTVRDFGIGTSSSLNFYIVANSAGDFVLYSPDGGKISYDPTGTTGLYQSVGSPSLFYGSTLIWTNGDTDGPFTVDLTNGTVLSFSDPAYLSQITDRYGNSIKITRSNVIGNLQTVTTSDGRWMKFTYGNCVTASPSTTCIKQVQDNSGRTVSYGYDASGRLTTVTNPAGGVTSYGWAPCTSAMTCAELLTATDPAGHVTSNTYNPTTGWITGQTDGVGGNWSYSYLTNTSGQIQQATVTDPRGIEQIYAFNASGLPSSVTSAAGTSSARTTSYVFDPGTNLLTSQTDPLGRTTSYAYDSRGDVTSVTYLTGTSSAVTWSYTYDPVYGRVASLTDPLGQTSTIAYNDSAQTETVTDPLGNQWVVTLNNEGQPIQLTNPAGGNTYMSYLFGNLIAVADPLGNASGTYYNSVGQELQSIDDEGNTTTYTYNALGEQASVTSPTGAVTSDGYDADGNLTSITDANGNKTSYTYNGDSELATKTDPLGKVTTDSYDGDGDLTQVIDAMSNKDTFAYDDFGDVTTARYGVSGTSQQTKIVNTYDLASRLTKAVQTPGGTYSLSYDGLGDILNQTSPQGTVTRAYNNDQQPTSLTVPGQTKITYTYDKDSNLTKVTQGTTSVTQAYNGLGRVTSLTLPDGIKDTKAYDADSDLTGQTFKKGTTSVGAVNYSYTANGQISSESGSLASAVLPAAVTGNTYNADNEISTWNGTAYAYNADGDLTSNGTNSYTWNDQNQLTGISGGVTASFSYNPFGQQVSSTVGGTATSYLFDGIKSDDNVVQEQSGGSPTANLLTGAPGQIFQFTTPSGTNSSLLTSRLDTTMALASSAGAITTSYSYTPHGAVTASGASSPSTFEFDATQNTGTGLYSMGERSYNPSTGTFMSQDPTGFSSGTDLYQFTNDDPINFNDPTGCGAERDFCVSASTLIGALALTGVALLALAFAPEAILASLALGDILGIAGLAAAFGGLIGNAVGTYPGNCPD
ncbi:MAG TPA: RHS repeat-associated core domain-containing protein [Streptosporangiaceae bacterium]